MIVKWVDKCKYRQYHSIFLRFSHLHKGLHFSALEYALHFLQGVAALFGAHHLHARTVLSPVQRPYPQFLEGLDFAEGLQIASELADEKGVVTAVEEDDDRVLDDADGGVDGHNGEEVGAEWVG